MATQLGSNADVGFGAMFDIFFVRIVSWLPRITVFSVRDMAGKFGLDAPLKLILRSIDSERIMGVVNEKLLYVNATKTWTLPDFSNVTMPDTSSMSNPLDIVSSYASFGSAFAQNYGSQVTKQALLNDNIPDFYQGILFTSLFAIIPLLLTCVWNVCVWCTCCYCCCGRCCSFTGCCCQPRDAAAQKAKVKDPIKFQKDQKKKRACQTCCRWFIFIYFALTVLVMILWAAFAYQSDIGVSNTINKVNDDFAIVVNATETIAAAPAQAKLLVNDFGTQVNITAAAVSALINTYVQNLTQIGTCVASLTSVLLPNSTELELLFSGITNTLQHLTQQPAIASLLQGINGIVSEFSSDFAAVQGVLTSAQTQVDAIPASLNALSSQLDALNAALDRSAASNDVVTHLTNIQTEKMVNMTVTDISNVLTDFASPSTPTGTTFAAHLQKIKTSLDILASINLTRLNQSLFEVTDMSGMLTATANLQSQLGSLSQQLSNVSNIGSSISDALGLFTTTSNKLSAFVATNLTGAKIAEAVLSGLPTMDDLVAAISKWNVSSSYGCVDEIFVTVDNFQNNLLQIPNNLSTVLTTLAGIVPSVGAMLTDNTSFVAALLPSLTLDSLRHPAKLIGMLMDSLNLTQMITGAIQGIAGQFLNASTIAQMVDPMLASLNVTQMTASLTSAMTAFNFSAMTSAMTSAMSGFDMSALNGSLATFSSTLQGNQTDMLKVRDATTLLHDLGKLQGVSSNIEALIAQFRDTVGAGYCSGAAQCDQADINVVNPLMVNFNASLHGTDLIFDIAIVTALNASTSGTGIIDSAAIKTQLATANSSVTSALNFTSFAAQLHDANSTLLSSIPDLGALLNSSVAPMTAMLSAMNVSSMLGMFSNSSMFSSMLGMLNISSLIGGITDSIFTTINTVASTVGGAVGAAGEFLGGAQPFLDTAVGYVSNASSVKDAVLANYVYPFDGYRLLAALFVVLFLIPLPCLGVFACCCHKKPCMLVCWALVLVAFSMAFWVVPIAGIPLGMFLDDACDNGISYANDALEYAGESAKFLNVTSWVNSVTNNAVPAQVLDAVNATLIERLVSEGVSADLVNGLVHQLGQWALSYYGSNLTSMIASLLGGGSSNASAANSTASNSTMTMDIGAIISGLGLNISNISLACVNLEFPTIKVQDVIFNYIDANRLCSSDDVIVLAKKVVDNVTRSVLNSTVLLINSVADGKALLGFKLGSGFQSYVESLVFPFLHNVTGLLDHVQPYVGCSSVSKITGMATDMVCNVVRFSSTFLWGILASAAIIFFLASCVNCCGYCWLEHCYTSDKDDKEESLTQYDDYEEDDLDVDDEKERPKEGDGLRNYERREVELKETAKDIQQTDFDQKQPSENPDNLVDQIKIPENIDTSSKKEEGRFLD